RKSLYFTFSAVNQRAGPVVVTIAKTTNKGRRTIRIFGGYTNQIIKRIRITNEIAKSTSATTTVAVGTIRRGKYTLLIRFAFPIRLLDASVSPVEKNIHGSIP